MQFEMSEKLRNYDIFPLVIPTEKNTTIHIRPLGGRQMFVPSKAYTVEISGIRGGYFKWYPQSADFTKLCVMCKEDGAFDITHTFKSEQEYFLTMFDGEKQIERFSVYAVAEDLQDRYPFRGDLHIHTNLSDGHQSPEVVCANYRSHGYDFFAITDHNRYYPSIRAMNFYKDIPTEFVIVPGEEVHIAQVNWVTPSAHIVNFGGLYSVNALVKDDFYGEFGEGDEYRSLVPNPPQPMTVAEFYKMIEDRAKEMDIPENINPTIAAAMNWVFEQIKKADGLAIFPHPNWIADNSFHVPDVFVDYLMEQRDFDAFEVLGGERYYEHNGFQTLRYYEDKAKGNVYPIVGSTDSHNSHESNDGSLICSTLVFAPENERVALIHSIKDSYSVAVDTISKEFRLVGDSRLCRYACFLLKNYTPRHDEACFEEGRLMKICATGTEEEREDAARMLSVIHGRMEKMRKKYFRFE